jgi:hypothetical protein
MLNFLKAKGSYFVAFLVVFSLVFSVSILPSFAQDGEGFDASEVEEMPVWDEAQMDEFEETMDEWEDTWEDYDESGWDDDFWSTEANYETAPGEVTGLAAFAIIMGIWGIVMLPLYIYFALTLMVTANKLGVKNAWFAWIPILNIILMFQCAGLSPWLFLLMFVPFVNIILMIVAYMKIAERRGFESWLGILMILPVANLIIPGYLAWGEPPKKAQ